MEIISVEPFSPLQSMDGIFFACVDIGNSNSAMFYCGETFFGVDRSMSKESPFQEQQVEGIKSINKSKLRFRNHFNPQKGPVKLEALLHLKEGDKVHAEFPLGMTYLDKNSKTHFEGRLLC